MATISYKLLKDVDATYLLTHYGGLIFPASVKTITANNQPYVSLISFCEQQPIGLLITQLKNDKTTELLSLFVQNKFKQQGVATNLLQLTEKFLIQIGAKHIDLTYLNSYNHAEILGKLLVKQDWLTPRPTVLNIKLNNKNVMKEKWISESITLQNEVEIFDWKNLTESDKQGVIKILQQGDFPKHLTPFQLEEILDGKISKGARVNGKIIGWCILHKINSKTNQCSALYVSKEHREKFIDKKMMASGFNDTVNKNIDFTIYQAKYEDKFLTRYLNVLFSKHNAIMQKAHTMASRKYLIK